MYSDPDDEHFTQEFADEFARLLHDSIPALIESARSIRDEPPTGVKSIQPIRVADIAKIDPANWK